ncbi:MAG: flagellar protein FlgN [Gammaproteobacteria bacterium]|nr:flagellar protein FlgN [Gammaproteobacteria bacterium]MDH5593672.1 flagellar protein FlgN [Gammaproteobacteria bacterium]
MSSTQQIQTLFEREIVLFQTLFNLFQTEREILRKRDTDALQLLQLEKQPVISELEKLQQDTDIAMKNDGFGNGLADINTFISQQNSRDQVRLQQLWNEVAALGEKCQKENLTIGGIVELNRLQVETALGILRGSKIGPAEYNPEGRLENNAVSQSLAKA